MYLYALIWINVLSSAIKVVLFFSVVYKSDSFVIAARLNKPAAGEAVNAASDLLESESLSPSLRLSTSSVWLC